MVGLSLLLNFAGILTGMGTILGAFHILDVENVGFSTFFTTSYGLVLTLTGAAIAIGFLTKSSTESILLIVYLGMLLTFVIDLANISTYLNSYGGESLWIGRLGLLLMSGLIAGYLHSVVSWWGGKA